MLEILASAKAELSCGCPFEEEQIPWCRRYIELTLELMTREHSMLDFKAIEGLYAKLSLTIAEFDEAKFAIKRSIAQSFGPLRPVTLTVAQNI